VTKVQAQGFHKTLRYPLQDYFSVHFVDADDADRAQNTELFEHIENILNSDATEELKQKMKLNVVRKYLERRPRMISPRAQSPLFTGNADFTIRRLLVMIPAHLSRCPGLSFPCPNPHFHSN
jgi:hypothetical protein